MFDVNKLTLGEIDKIEDLSGLPITEIGGDSAPKGKMMAALAYVIKRRQQMSTGLPPSFTWNEAMDLTMDEANDILGITEEDTAEALQEPQEAPNRAARRASTSKGKNGAAKGRTVPHVPEPDPTPGE